MTPMDEREFRDLATRWLLGELDPDERAEFEVALSERGSDGEREVREIAATLGDLALTVPPVAPPAALRDRVLAGARDGAVATAPAGVPLPARLGPWRAVAGVAALLALVAGAWALSLRSDQDRLRAELQVARTRLAAADSAAQWAAAARADLELLASPATRVHGLAGTDEEPAARARVFLDPATGRAILFADELPILPPDAVYCLWSIRGETPRPAGVFRPGPDGRARVEIADRTLVEGVDALAVTVEPAPGKGSTPTGRMVLISDGA